MFANNDIDLLRETKKNISNKFEMKDLENAFFILRI